MAYWPRDRVDVVALSPQAVHKRLRDGSPTFGTIAPRSTKPYAIAATIDLDLTPLRTPSLLGQGMTRDNWLFAISLAWLIMLWVMIFVVLASCSKAKLICSTGGLANFVSSGRAKNISLSRLVETDLLIPLSVP